GISTFSIPAEITEFKPDFPGRFEGLRLPEHAVKSIRPAVQMMAAIVFFQPVPSAVQFKPRILNPTGHTPDQSPQKVGIAFIFPIVSVSQNHIFPPSLLVGN